MLAGPLPHWLAQSITNTTINRHSDGDIAEFRFRLEQAGMVSVVQSEVGDAWLTFHVAY